MDNIRWGFTFLMGAPQLSPEERQKLLVQATVMYLSGEERAEVIGDRYDGVIYTNREWKVMGGVAGQQFDAVLETELDSPKLHIRFLVSEHTQGQGMAYSNN